MEAFDEPISHKSISVNPAYLVTFEMLLHTWVILYMYLS